MRRFGALACIYVVSFGAPLIGWLSWYAHVAPTLTGDEPHYLATADSIVHDRDLDLTNNLADPNGISSIYPNLPDDHTVRHDGALRPVQGVGMGVVLAPGVVRGSVSELAEKVWARRWMILLAAVLAQQLFLLMRALVRDKPWAAWFAWLAWCTALPVTVYSNQFYPEIPAALACVVAMRCARRAGGLAAFATGAAVAPLPWLSVRYAPLGFAFVAWPLVRDDARSWRRRSQLAGLVLAPIAVSCLGLAFWYERAFGTMWLPSAYRTAHLSTDHGLLATYERTFDALLSPYGGLFIYAPVLLLGVVGAGVAWRAHRRATLVALAGAFVYLVGSAPYGFRGYALPGRMVVVLTPLAAVGLALLVMRFRVALIPCALLLAFGLVVVFQAGQQPAYGALCGDGAQPVGVLRPFTGLFPTVNGATGATSAELGSDRDAHYGPVTMRAARYRATLVVTCECARVTLTVLTSSDVYAHPRVRASTPLDVMHGEAYADVVASHSGEVFTFAVSPARAAGLLHLEATSRTESLDDPIRRSIPVSAAWVVALFALALGAAQLGKGDRPSRLRTSGRRKGGSVGGG